MDAFPLERRRKRNARAGRLDSSYMPTSYGFKSFLKLPRKEDISFADCSAKKWAISLYVKARYWESRNICCDFQDELTASQPQSGVRVALG